MFARHVSLRLKPNTLSELTRIFDKEVIPMLRKQSGFRDEITFAIPGGLDVVAISLWDTREHGEVYSTAGYPEVLKILDKVLDGTHKVQVSDVISSTIHKPAAVAALDGARQSPGVATGATLSCSQGSSVGRAHMTPRIQVGTILVEDRTLVTRILDLESGLTQRSGECLTSSTKRFAASDETIPSWLRK